MKRTNLFSPWAYLLALLVLCLGASQVTFGQAGTGELTGTIMDQTGAAVAGATVTLTNAATGYERTMQTPDAGLYRFSALQVVGTYELKIDAKGFKAIRVGDIVISVGRTTTVDAKLEIGTASETVSVEAGAELVTPTQSELSDLLDSKVWQSLPLEVRNQNTFINLLAGVVPGTTGDRATDFTGTTRGAAVNGARPGMGNFLLEGYDNNDQGQGGRGSEGNGAIVAISPEAIQEYRVITHSYSAEYGKGGGFVTDTVLKTGTNTWHGSAFDYNRIQALAANDFFSNASGTKDKLIRNQFGGSLGGPIWKDKTFFYAGYEGHRRREASPVTDTVTTQQFIDFVKSGAFKTFMESSPNGLCVRASGAACPGAFANSATLGSIAGSLLGSQPFPLAQGGLTNVAQGQFTNSLFTDKTSPLCATAKGCPPLIITYPVPVYGTATAPSSDAFNQSRASLKLDHKLSQKHSLSGTFLFQDSQDTTSVTGGDTTFGPPILNDSRNMIIGVTLTSTFTQSVINQFRASFLRDRSDFPDFPGTQGVPSIVTFGDPLAEGFGQTSSLPQFFTNNQFQYKDDVSVLHGKHAFKFGGEYRRTRNGSSFQAVKNGLFEPWDVENLLTDGFFGDEVDKFFFGAPTFGGIAEAQASINPLTGNFPEYYRGYRANEMALYLQDDWKVHSRLTLNLGLRWEYFGPPHNFKAGLDSNFYFGSPLTPLPNPFPATCTGSGKTCQNPFYPLNSPLAAEVVNGGFVQKNHDIWHKDTNNFGPRLGFAWDVLGTQKLIVRAGGGFFYDRIWNNLFENIRFNAPFFAFSTLGNAAGAPVVGPLATPGLYSNPFTSPQAFKNFAGLPAPRHMDENLVTPYTQQYNAGIQWAAAKSLAFEVNGSYTGGRDLTGVIDINTYDGRTACSSATPRAACVAAQAAGIIPKARFSNRRVTTTLAGDNFRTNAFASNYYGLQFVVRKSFSSGLQFNSNYTWSHAIDELSDAFNGARGKFLRTTDNMNVHADKGSSDFDIRHRWVTSFTYDLPFFKEHRFLGGWSTSGIWTMQTGGPIPIFLGTTSGDANRDGYLTDRPVISGDPYVRGKSPADGWLDPASFGKVVCPSTVNFGLWCDSPTGRNTLRGPHFVNADFGVAKKFRVNERANIQFQANFFNIFNHTNFKTPDGNVSSPTFGQSLAEFGGPRVTQLALRLDF